MFNGYNTLIKDPYMPKLLLLVCIIVSPFLGKVLNAQNPYLKLELDTLKQLQIGSSIKLKVRVKYETPSEQTGTITLSLFNKQNNNAVDGWFLNIFPFQYFTTLKGVFFETEFPFTIPNDFSGAFELAINAKAGSVADSVRYTILTIQKQ